MKLLTIVKRAKPIPHYELHYPNHVEFWTLDDVKLGESKVEAIP